MPPRPASANVDVLSQADIHWHGGRQGGLIWDAAQRVPAIYLMALALTSGLAADKARFYDQVLGLDEKSITLYRSPTKEAKFTVPSSTKIIVDCRQARIENVKVGMKATVYRKADSDEATSISARSMK